MQKLFIWDLNWTIETGSEIALTKGMNEALIEFGFSQQVPLQVVVDNYGKTWEDIYTAALGDMPEDVLKEMRERAEYLCNIVHCPNDMTLRPYAKEVLESVCEQGGTNVIISNASQKGVDIMADQLQITHLFQTMIGVSKNKRYNSKPHAAKTILNGKHYDRVISTGDSPGDLAIAYQLGCTGIGCRASTNGQSFISYLLEIPQRQIPITNENHRVSDLREIVQRELGVIL